MKTAIILYWMPHSWLVLLWELAEVFTGLKDARCHTLSMWWYRDTMKDLRDVASWGILTLSGNNPVGNIQNLRIMNPAKFYEWWWNIHEWKDVATIARGWSHIPTCWISTNLRYKILDERTLPYHLHIALQKSYEIQKIWSQRHSVKKQGVCLLIVDIGRQEAPKACGSEWTGSQSILMFAQVLILHKFSSMCNQWIFFLFLLPM